MSSEILFHEHRGQVYPLRQGGDTMYWGIWYERWLCSGSCERVTLIRKRDQRVQVREGEVVSAYGFSVNDKVAEKKTGRRALVTGFGKVYGWRTIDGKRRHVVLNDQWTIVYRWIEPVKPGGRIMDTSIGVESESFLRRFQKLEDES